MALALCLEISGPASAARIQGVGNQSCAEFSESVGKFGREWELHSYAWAQGWLSRRNVDREARGLSPIPDLSPDGFGTDAQMAFMRTYCTANPGKDYVYGVDEIFRKLLQMYSLSV
jgi:hypothetical protein